MKNNIAISESVCDAAPTTPKSRRRGSIIPIGFFKEHKRPPTKLFIPIIFLFVAIETVSVAVALGSEAPNADCTLGQKREYVERHERVSQWYLPERFGMFCHWGLFTGGGDSCRGHQDPFCYDTIAEFEAAARDPDLIASNLVTTAKNMGARYITFTLLHSCDRYTVMFPTKTYGFKMKTTKDYIGALGAWCQREHMHLILYLCGGPDQGFTEGGPWLEDPLRDAKEYNRAIKGLLDELAVRHPGMIAGFWIDGSASDLPEYMRRRYPGCVIIHNNDTCFSDPNIDFGTTEFLNNPADPDYSRPSGLLKCHPKYNTLPPRPDYNEDIPCAGSWWYGEFGTNADWYRALPYVSYPKFIVRQMVSSLGQRREWNFSLGVGPMIDGRFPSSFEPMVQALHNFLSWGAESIYNTMGGEGSALNPGWWNDGAYGSITVSIKNPRTLYIHVTTEPKAANLQVPNNGRKVDTVVDLRTGDAVKFTDGGALMIWNQDWSDVKEYGDKVFKITMAVPKGE